MKTLTLSDGTYNNTLSLEDSTARSSITSLQTTVGGKADKVSNPTNGNLAALDSNGNLKDSGIAGTGVSTAVTNAHTHGNKTTLDNIRVYRSLTGTAAVTSSPYSHSKWDVSDSSVAAYTDGMVVCLTVPVAGNGTYGTALQINSLGYKPVVYNINSMVGTRYGVGSVVWCVYNSSQTGSLYQNSASASTVTGCWQVMDYDSNNHYYQTAYSTTAAATAAKTATFTNFVLQPDSYVPVQFTQSNTKAAALTLNINSTGAKAIWINGVASSASNYTLPAGFYIAYYDGTHYLFRTDGKMPIGGGAFGGSYTDLSDKPAIPAGPLEVTFTESNDTWTCDTPVIDICDALDSNTRVLAKVPLFGYFIMEPLMYYSDSNSAFVAIAVTSGFSSNILEGEAEYDSTTGTWTDTWTYSENTAVSLSEYQGGMREKADSTALAGDYNNFLTYAVGDYCVYDGILYRCTTAITTAEDFNSSHWTMVTVLSLLAGKQDTLVSGTNIKTVNGTSILGSGNISVTGGTGGDANVIETVKVNGTALTVDANKAVDVTVPTATSDLTNDSGFLTSHQDISGKTDTGIIAESYSSSSTYTVGDFCIYGGALYCCITAIDTEEAWTAAHWRRVSVGPLLQGKQDTLVSGTSIKTVNNNSLLGSGNIAVQPTLVSGTNIKTINGTSILGSGDITISGSSSATSDHDFHHTTSSSVSGTVSVSFDADVRGTRMMEASADIALSLTVNNSSDNYIWVLNTGGSDIDITINSITYLGDNPTSIYFPTDGITVEAGMLCEIGVICNTDGAFITARCDLENIA